MDTQQNDKSVLITGCSSGIGRATALHLARSGFTVFATVRKEADADALRGLGEPDLIPICPLDLAHIDQIPGVVAAVNAEIERRGQPGLYALINNAGGGQIAPVELMDLEKFQTELNTRILGPAALVQAFLPSIRRAHGCIIWITTPATIPTPYVASIHTCDFAVNCMARTLDIELKPWKIPNILIRCGGILTPAGMRTTQDVERTLQHPNSDLYAQILRKWGHDMLAFDAKRTDPQKVAEVVLKALCSPKPKRRYAIGYMSSAAAFLEALPQPLTDAILKLRF